MVCLLMGFRCVCLFAAQPIILHEQLVLLEKGRLAACGVSSHPASAVFLPLPAALLTSQKHHLTW